MRLFKPDLTFSGGRLHAGGLLVNEAGLVQSGPAPTGVDEVRLPGRLLLPGLVNAHSHAFQRLLRGRTERRNPSVPSDDFWAWRELMYQVANRLTPESLYAVSRQAFLEMALAGVTHVGEFHYLHHQPDGTPYDDVLALDAAVVRAAREVGLRLTLLRVGYARAGHRRPDNPLQRRFLDPDAETWLQRTALLARTVAGDALVTVGLAPHSVRAVPRDWLQAAAAFPGVVHAHVAEQPAEVEACLAEHGLRPVELLDDVGLLGPRFTAVHGVHLSPTEVALLGRARATVCACPSTERNLGDGIVRADVLLEAGVPLCLGSDSQAQVDLLDEARQLDGHLRLLTLRRSALPGASVEVDALARVLLEAATGAGTRALGGGDASPLAPGTPADFFTVDVSHPTLAGAGDGEALATAVFAATPACVREVAVQGRLMVRDGRHRAQEAIGAEYREAARGLHL